MNADYIHPVPGDFGLFEMLLDIGQMPYFEKFEFVSYDPEENDPDAYSNEPRVRMLVSPDELRERGLDDIGKEICRGDEVLGLGSFAKIGNYWVHLPQIDFSCQKSPGNETMVYEFLETAKRRGYVLDSGRSYHFQGTETLEHDEWIKFMKSLVPRSVEQGPLIDVCYPSIMQDLGYSVLRLSANRKSKQIVPAVIARVGDATPKFEVEGDRTDISDDFIPF